MDSRLPLPLPLSRRIWESGNDAENAQGVHFYEFSSPIGPDRSDKCHLSVLLYDGRHSYQNCAYERAPVIAGIRKAAQAKPDVFASSRVVAP